MRSSATPGDVVIPSSPGRASTPSRPGLQAKPAGGQPHRILTAGPYGALCGQGFATEAAAALASGFARHDVTR